MSATKVATRAAVVARGDAARSGRARAPDDREIAVLNAEWDKLMEKIDHEMERGAAIMDRLAARYGV